MSNSAHDFYTFLDAAQSGRIRDGESGERMIFSRSELADLARMIVYDVGDIDTAHNFDPDSDNKIDLTNSMARLGAAEFGLMSVHEGNGATEFYIVTNKPTISRFYNEGDGRGWYGLLNTPFTLDAIKHHIDASIDIILAAEANVEVVERTSPTLSRVNRDRWKKGLSRIKPTRVISLSKPRQVIHYAEASSGPIESVGGHTTHARPVEHERKLTARWIQPKNRRGWWREEKTVVVNAGVRRAGVTNVVP